MRFTEKSAPPPGRVKLSRWRWIKERGFLAVMWPKLLAFLVLLVLWVVFLRWYF